MSDQTISLVRELGSFGVLLVAFYLVSRYVLYLRAYEAFVLYREQQLTRCSLDNLTVVLLHHDMTVRGLNPDAGSGIDERVEEAIRVWSSLIKSFEEHKNRVNSISNEIPKHWRPFREKIAPVPD